MPKANTIDTLFPSPLRKKRKAIVQLCTGAVDIPRDSRVDDGWTTKKKKLLS